MECPICYDDCQQCHLVCGHSLCHSCVKKWWSSSSTQRDCPMCRRPLYFRGMRAKVQEWDDERRDSMKSAVYAKLVDEILEDVEPEYAMEELEWLDERFTRWGDLEFTDEEEMYEVLGDIFTEPIPVSYGMFYFDVWPFHNSMLFVSKHSMKRYPRGIL